MTSFDYYDYYWFLLILQYYDGTRPLLVSRFALDRSVAMGRRPKCRPIRLLSGWIPLYAPTVKLPRRTAYPHTRVCRDTTCDRTFVPPTPAPPPKTVIADTTPWFVLSFRYGGQMSAMVTFGGTCVWGAGKCPARVTYLNVVTISLV